MGFPISWSIDRSIISWSICNYWLRLSFIYNLTFFYWEIKENSKLIKKELLLQDEWVVCRVFHKNSSTGIRKSSAPEELLRMNSFGDDLLDCSSLPPLMDPPFNANPAYFSMRENNQHDQKIIFQLPTNNIYQNSNPNPSSSLYPQTPTSFSFDPNPNPAAGYNLHQGYGFGVGDHQQQGTSGSGLERQCKVEQFSSNNQSMLSRSQDTGLSTDMNAEISSVVSKQDIVGSNRSYHDHLHQGPSNIGPIADLDCLWDYWRVQNKLVP